METSFPTTAMESDILSTITICKTADSETAFFALFFHVSTRVLTSLHNLVNSSEKIPQLFICKKIILSLELEEHVSLGFLLFWKKMVLSKSYTA